MSNQDLYLYMQMKRRDELYRLNISKLVCEKSRSQLEGPQKFKVDKDVRNIIVRKMFKNSVTNTVHLLQWPYRGRGYCEVVATIDTKLYVLVRINRTGRLLFQVYDPFHGLWKILPNPPISDPQSGYLYGHFEWGHKLSVFDERCRGPSYVFDTIEEKWTPADGLPHLVCAVDFLGFLIGIELSRYSSSQSNIVAYKLDDENGLPDPYSKHILNDELWEIFYPPLKRDDDIADTAFLIRFSDDHVLFLTTADKFIVVAVFRVSISAVGGFPVVSAVFEHKQLYKRAGYASCISSVFLMQDAPSYGAHIRIRRTMPPIMLDDHPLLADDDNEDHDDAPPPKETTHEQDDSTALALKAQAFENKLMADMEWNVVVEKSLYLCFVENRTDSSVSYVIKAMKFSDLISKSSHDSNSKLRQVASTSGCHLGCWPSCGAFGSQILIAGGGDQDNLCSRDIHFYDVTSNDPRCYSNIKRFTKSFKGMKPQPVLAEVEGKLYALAGSTKPQYLNRGPYFEVFDPIEKEWSPLPDPPPYTKFRSSRNSHAIAGTNILAWSNESPGVFRFDMAADSIDKDWRLIKNSHVFSGGYQRTYGHQSTIVMESDGNGRGDFVLFTYKNDWINTGLQVNLISREFDHVVCLPNLELPASVSTFRVGGSSFIHLGGRRVCLVLSSPFEGPYSTTLHQLGEIEKMSILILVFEFEVGENRESVVAEFIFHRMLEYEYDTSSGNSKTSDTHMVGAFLL